MVSQEKILTHLTQIFIQELQREVRLTPQMSLKDDLKMTPYLIKEIVIQIEEFYEIRMSRKVFLGLKTVDDLIRWLQIIS